MLIDQYLPQHHYSEYHRIQLTLVSGDVFNKALQTNFRNSLVIQLLFRLRGMPKVSCSIRDLHNLGFTKLNEKTGEEIVFGIISKTGTFSSCTPHFSPEEFINDTEPEHIKSVINFRLETINLKDSVISTETRVLCGSKRMKNKFRIYWFFVQPFSSLIRKMMLREIKKCILKQTFLEDYQKMGQQV